MLRGWPRLLGRKFVNLWEQENKSPTRQKLLKEIHDNLIQILEQNRVSFGWIMKLSEWKGDTYIVNSATNDNWWRIEIWMLWQHSFDVRLYKWPDWIYRLTKKYNDIPLWAKAIPNIVMDILFNPEKLKNPPQFQESWAEFNSQRIQEITKDENSKEHIQKELQEIYETLLSYLQKKRLRDIDKVVLEKWTNWETIFMLWWHPTDLNKQIYIWMSQDRKNAIILGKNDKWIFDIKLLEKSWDWTIFHPDAIPTLIKTYVENIEDWWFIPKIIKWKIVLVPMDLRMHELAQREPSHEQQFFYISKKFNLREQQQSELELAHKFLDDLLESNWITNSSSMLEIDSEIDKWKWNSESRTICVRKKWNIFELWVVGKSQDNVILYKDANWKYCLRRRWFRLDVLDCKDNKLLWFEAIPWLIRDFIEYQGRLEASKIRVVKHDSDTIFWYATAQWNNPWDNLSLEQLPEPRLEAVSTWTDEATWLDIF